MQNQSNTFYQDTKTVRRSEDDVTPWKQPTLLPEENKKADMMKFKQRVIDEWLLSSEPMVSANEEQPMQQSLPFSPFTQQVMHDQQDKRGCPTAEFDNLHISNAPQPNNRAPRSLPSSSALTGTGRLIPLNPFQMNYGVDWSGYVSHSHMNINVWKPSHLSDTSQSFDLFSSQAGPETTVGQQTNPTSVGTSLLTTLPLSNKTLSHESASSLPRLQLATSSTAMFKGLESNMPSTKAEKTTWSKVVKGENLTEPPFTGTSSSSPGSSNNTSTRYITDSISYMTSKLQTDGNTQKRYTVIKVTNFPWEVNASVIKQVFEQSASFVLPPELPQCVHVMMDAKSGKTLGVAFVEVVLKLKNRQDIVHALKNLSMSCIQCTRRPQFSLSSYDELYSQLFPNWKGQFLDGLAISQPPLKTVHNMIVDSKKSAFFISQKELQALLNVCRNYKINYNRRCSERPFEYLISIVMHMPWNQVKTVTTTQRDILYECYKLATASLYEHTSKKMHSFESDILLRFVRAGLLCDGFTYRQKNDILHHAHMECPEDLRSYIEAPAILNNSEFTTLLRL
ncbi:hypothetical protein EDC96DRAFT_519226 [Choanephora cucurbitarum]|nr:hypothetical protein EDC96DRAFT_519226 [Choanephora cucurbitarum]